MRLIFTVFYTEEFWHIYRDYLNWVGFFDGAVLDELKKLNG